VDVDGKSSLLGLSSRGLGRIVEGGQTWTPLTGPGGQAASRRGSGLLPSLPRQAWVVLGGDFISAVGSGLTLPFLFIYAHRVRAY